MRTLTQKLFLLEPQYRERVWGGRRLKAAEPPVGEAWVAFEESRVGGGEFGGKTVGELAAERGAAEASFQRILWTPPGLGTAALEVTDARQKAFV